MPFFVYSTIMPKEHEPTPHNILNLNAIDTSFREVQFYWEDIQEELEKETIGRKDTPFGSNHIVHYGYDMKLREEHASAIRVTYDRFHSRIDVIRNWYVKHEEKKDHPLKLASEVYVSILSKPQPSADQLFFEGNHRTGSLIANWINLWHGYPPFVLSVHNAIDYFAPSAAIKKFDRLSAWRKGGNKMPKYTRDFRKFWEEHIDETYISH
jgi:hypothetical protein